MYQPPPNQWPSSGPPPYTQYPQQQPYPNPSRKKWYQGSGGILLLLILFFPVGLYLMWRHAAWPKAAKWIVTAIFALLVIVNVSSSGGQTDAPTGKAQLTPQAQQPTQAPTATPKPLTTEQRILAIANEHKGKESAYDAGQGYFETTIKLGTQWSDGTMKDSVKMQCYDLQRDLWTANPSLDLESVVVFVHGDVIDQYGKESVEQVGFCNLKKATAAKFQWQNLTWKSAWGIYDNQGLAPFLQRA